VRRLKVARVGVLSLGLLYRDQQRRFEHHLGHRSGPLKVTPLQGHLLWTPLSLNLQNLATQLQT